ncbi:MAG: signal peptide peptidase SppA [Anaerolineae bacterium]|nr:signal peptide peptidase SppA [Anaerolineae bacterium]
MLAYLFYPIRYFFWALGNLLRRLCRAPDYVTFTLEGEYPELRQPPGNFIMRRLRPPKISLQELAEQFRTIAADARVRGVVLHLRPLDMPPGQLDSLRDLIKELRAAGKRVVAWSYTYNSATYYVACAADEILLIPGGTVTSLGLHHRYVYLADALERVGLQADILQITPYKSAADMFTRSSMSDEARQMANWLMDATYEEVLRAIAEGRRMDEEAARTLIDNTPCTDLKAKEMGAIDEVISEEDLPTHLQEGPKPARLTTWDKAGPRLRRRPPTPPGRYVALLSIEGMIVDGHSQRPPFRPPIPVPFILNKRAGDLSVVQVARKVLADRRAAAVVLYVDSGGGSATASEAMRAALEKIAAKKPLVVAMGAIAASGGYWVSTPSQVIIAQPNTITGSIGVLGGKFVNAGLLEKLLVSREIISRGKTALFYDFERPFSDEEREIVWEGIQRIYDMFLDRVSASREMTRQEVDAIGGGRVWSGRQALENGLVDEFGGLERALEKARQLAGLSERAPVRAFTPDKKPIAPLPEAASALAYALEGLRMFNRPGPLCLCPLVWEQAP